jgi:DNA polymerase
VVAEEASTCTKCKLATAGRTQVVFGMGDPDADLMFVGEGPGAEEDKQGLPFVGRSGQLLDKILFEELGITRDRVYIANTVLCRPPGNRDPEADEIAACNPWLEKKLELIQPKVIVTLGNFATKFVLQTPLGITRVRGSVHTWHGRKVIPTFHPAAILHGGGEKSRQFEQLREDFSLIRSTLDAMSEDPAAVPTPTPTPPPTPVPARVPEPMQARPPGTTERLAEVARIGPDVPDPDQLELF